MMGQGLDLLTPSPRGVLQSPRGMLYSPRGDLYSPRGGVYPSPRSDLSLQMVVKKRTSMDDIFTFDDDKANFYDRESYRKLKYRDLKIANDIYSLAMVALINPHEIKLRRKEK